MTRCDLLGPYVNFAKYFILSQNVVYIDTTTTMELLNNFWRNQIFQGRK